MASSYEPTGETVLLAIKPALRSILLRSMRTVFICAVLAGGAHWGLPAISAGVWRGDVNLVLGGVVAVRALWECAVWASRRYLLTARRVVSISGVLRRQIRDLPIERVQNAVLDRTLGERIFGLGTIGIASAGSAWIDVAWIMIPKSPQRLQMLREAIGSSGSSGLGEPPPETKEVRAEVAVEKVAREHPLVIGVAGGIGAGKSALAGALAKLGCVVIDSDALAKGMLDEPEVVRVLREWWGDSIVGESGRVDRSRVASIVFEDSEQRARLESLIHPRVKEARKRVIEENRDARAIVIDAPLLFEAGVNKECDAVLFVDVPREIRHSRVRASRDWDEQEVARREAGQWAVDRKRAASDVVIDNSGSGEALEERAARALVDLEARFGAGSKKNPPS